MKNVWFLLCIVLLMAGCVTKKTETKSESDSLAVNVDLATQPAPPTLAFDEISGFFLDNKLAFKDSVNYFLFNSQEELNKKFDTSKTSARVVTSSDFIINYVIAVACLPTQNLTTIVMDKVEINDRDINVYLNIQRGEKQTLVSKPSRIFAIEKRDGYLTMQFFVNGKKDKAIMLQ